MTSGHRADWRAYKLDELGFAGRGRSRHRPRNDPTLYGGAYPFVQTGDIKGANLYLRDYSQTYNEVGLAQSKLWEPGTLCITIAANIAETAILGIRACFPDSVIGFVPHPKTADVRFVKYYIDTIKMQMQQVSHGTTQDNLSLDKLLRFDFVVPPLPAQRQVASILSAYDDLIENNLRRIKVLEEMAQALYREWFVKFRFHSHEKVRLVDSPLGKIPEGWVVGVFSELTTVQRRNIRPADKPDEWFAHFSIPAYDQGQLAEKELGDTIKSGKYLLIGEAVLLAKLNPRIPRVWLAQPEPGIRSITSTEFLVLEPFAQTPVSYLYALCTSSEFADRFASHALGTSTSHQRVKPADLMAMPVVLPIPEIRNAFADIADPLVRLPYALRVRNRLLARTRDLLLPRLISGELDVSDLDISTREEPA